MAEPTLGQILPLLRGVMKSGNGYKAYCPAHDDRKTKSLSIHEKDGKLLLKCFGPGCEFQDILHSLGISTEKSDRQDSSIAATYDYIDDNGTLIFQVVRMQPKRFMQRRPDIFEGWVWDLKGVERMLYWLPELRQAIEEGETIFFVEGEKDVDNLRAAGFKATTSSGGCQGKWLPQYTESLQGAQITIIPDQDEPGKEYGHRVGTMLYGWTKSIKWLDLDAKDVSDWLQSHDPQTLHNLNDNAPDFMPNGAITREEFAALQAHLVYVTNRINRYIHPAYKKRDKKKTGEVET